MNNEIAILIVGTGENQIIFEVGKPAYWSYELKDQKRRVIEEIKKEKKDIGDNGRTPNQREVFIGYNYHNVIQKENMLFEVPVENCVVIYKAALEVVNE